MYKNSESQRLTLKLWDDDFINFNAIPAWTSCSSPRHVMVPWLCEVISFVLVILIFCCEPARVMLYKIGSYINLWNKYINKTSRIYSDVSLFLKPHFNLRAMTPNIWKNEAEYVNLHSTCWILIHGCGLEIIKEVI